MKRLHPYDEPCKVLGQAIGIQEEARPRLLVSDTRTLKEVGRGTGKFGPIQAVGVRSVVVASPESVAARFDDGTPAVVERPVGRGHVVHFACMPGLSYWRSSNQVKDGLPVSFSESVRNWISWPVRLADVSLPILVNRSLVEAPMVASSAGIAVTLLNWSGEPLSEIQVEVRSDKNIGRVESVRHGRLEFRAADGRIRFSLPLESADIVTLR